MLFAANVMAFLILGVVNARTLVPGDRAVGLRPGFHVLDMPLVTLKTRCFLAGQLAGFNTFVDTFLLHFLTFIDARRCSRVLRLGING